MTDPNPNPNPNPTNPNSGPNGPDPDKLDEPVVDPRDLVNKGGLPQAPPRNCRKPGGYPSNAG